MNYRKESRIEFSWGYMYMPKCGIYTIRNKVNNKQYVGQSVDISRRWRFHRCSLRNGKQENPYLQASWDKYGEHSFEFAVLELCLEEQLNAREAFHIADLQTNLRSKGYNLNDFSEGRRVLSPETRAKMSQAKIGHKMPAKTLEALRKTHLGVPFSQERRDRLRECNLGRKVTPETRAKLSESHKGYKTTDETKAKLSAVNLGQKRSPETCAKMSAASKGRKKTPEHVEAMRAARRARKALMALPEIPEGAPNPDPEMGANEDSPGCQVALVRQIQEVQV